MAEEIVKKLIILESINYKKTRKMAQKIGIFRNGLNFRKKHEKSIFVKHGKKP